MNISTNYKILLLLRIILPSFICVLLFKIFTIDISYHVFFFGFIIAVFNLNKTNYNYIVSLVFSICLSYLAFLISIGLYFGIGYILMQFIQLDKLEEISIFNYNFKNFLMLFPITVFSPLLVFVFYKVLFKIDNGYYFRVVKWITISLLVIYGIIQKDFENESISVFWQLIMALSIQLVINEKQIKKLRRKQFQTTKDQ